MIPLPTSVKFKLSKTVLLICTGNASPNSLIIHTKLFFIIHLELSA
jgi:hypothetical protein